MADTFYIASNDDAPANDDPARAQNAAGQRSDVQGGEVFMAGDAEENPAPVAAQKAELPSEAPVTESGASTLRARLRRATEQGLLERIPAVYERGEDWQTVCSDDPFERLYLDREQIGRITDEMVRSRVSLLRRYWEQRIEDYDGGMGDPAARDRFVKRYGRDSIFRSFPADIEQAAAQLRTAADRQAYADRFTEQQYERALNALDEDLEMALADHSLERSEIERLLKRAEANGLPEARAATHVLERLKLDGYRALGPASDASPRDRLLSTDWGDETVKDNHEIPTHTRTELMAFIHKVLQDEELTPDEVRKYLKQAVKKGVSKEQAAVLLYEHLGTSKYRPAHGETMRGAAVAEMLCSVRWLSPARYDESPPDPLLGSPPANPPRPGIKDVPEAGQQHIDEQQRQSEARQRLEEQRSGSGAKANLYVPDYLRDTSQLRSARRPWLLALGAVAGVAMLVALNRDDGPSGTEMQTGSNADTGGPTVTAERINVRSSPSTRGSDVLGTLGQGASIAYRSVHVDCERDAIWVSIPYGSSEGWVSAQNVSGLPWSSAQEHPNCRQVVSPPVDASRIYGEDEVDQPARPQRRLADVTSDAVSRTQQVGFRLVIRADGSVGELICTDAGEQVCADAASAFYRLQFSPAQLRGASVASRQTAFVTLEPSSGRVPAPTEVARAVVDTDRIYEANEVDETAALRGTLREISTEAVTYPQRVRINVVVGTDGRIRDPGCTDGISTCREALAYVENVRFRPARIQGIAVPTRQTLSVSLVPSPPRVGAAGPEKADSGQEERTCSDGATLANLERQISRQQIRCPTLTEKQEQAECFANLERLRARRAAC